MAKVSRISKGTAETVALAAAFARGLKEGDIVCLKGDLGAGKTVFAKGVARAMGVPERLVNSPTFVVMNVYQGRMPVYHFDLYRLEKDEDLKSVHFDEYLYGRGICIIEWPERLKRAMPADYWLVELTHKDESTRNICISYPSNPRRHISV